METIQLEKFLKENDLMLWVESRNLDLVNKGLEEHYCYLDPKGTYGSISIKTPQGSDLFCEIGNGNTKEAAILNFIEKYSNKTINVWKMGPSVEDVAIIKTIQIPQLVK